MTTDPNIESRRLRAIQLNDQVYLYSIARLDAGASQAEEVNRLRAAYRCIHNNVQLYQENES